jgi:hypothetical protein
MGWLDALERRGREATGSIPDLPKADLQAINSSVKPEIKTVWVQTARPRNGDAGEVEPGFYSVVDGLVTMHDKDGKPTGKTARLSLGDDPQGVAHRMAREAWSATLGEGNFNRPINYQPLGIA